MDPLVLFHGVYQVLGGIAAAPAMFLSSLSGRGGGYWLDRLGSPAAGGGNPYWLHAASVGEAGSAAAVIRAWKDMEPDARFVLSVGTPAGRAFAEESLGDLPNVQFMAPPMDVWGAPGRTLARVDPRALVIIETEIWPGLIRAAWKRHVPVILAAGRISERTARRFGWVKSFFGQVLNFMERLFVISEADRERFLSLGVDPAKVEVLGSPKFDPLIAVARGPAPRPIVSGPPYLLVAGSTHPGEEELITSELLKTLISRALHSSSKPFTPESYSADTQPAIMEAWKEVGSEAHALREVLGQTNGRNAMAGSPAPPPLPGEEPSAEEDGAGEPAGDGDAGSGNASGRGAAGRGDVADKDGDGDAVSDEADITGEASPDKAAGRAADVGSGEADITGEASPGQAAGRSGDAAQGEADIPGEASPGQAAGRSGDAAQGEAAQGEADITGEARPGQAAGRAGDAAQGEADITGEASPGQAAGRSGDAAQGEADRNGEASPGQAAGRTGDAA
ncbi:MAG: hypothetical protein LBT40_02730, partial [Deltaproteobacteria bacterium]|nr:hypothetical protein [Deltaproteobacteria bacterium]